MSVRHAMLALLSEGQVRAAATRGVRGAYRRGLAAERRVRSTRRCSGWSETASWSPRDGEDGPQKGFRITEDGERELARWLRTPPDLSSPPRDELVMKVLIALRVPGADVHEVIQAHRRYLVELMQQWTRIKEDDAGRPEPALAVDAELFRLDCGRPVAGCRRRPHQARGRRGGDDLGGPGEHPNQARAPLPRHRREMRHSDEHAGAAPGLQVLRARRRRGARLARGEPDGRRGRDGRGDGAQRIGQEHAADHRRNAGGPDRRRGADRRAAGGKVSRNAKARLRRRAIGYVFQDFNLLPGLTAAENVRLPLELDGLSARKAASPAWGARTG